MSPIEPRQYYPRPYGYNRYGNGMRLPTGAIIGIACGGAALLLLLLTMCCVRRRRMRARGPGVTTFGPHNHAMMHQNHHQMSQPYVAQNGMGMQQGGMMGSQKY